MRSLGLFLLLALSWMPTRIGAFSTPEGFVTADYANLEDDKANNPQPKAELDWLVEVLQREPFYLEEAEVKAHFSPLSGKADYIVDFEALLARVTGKLILKETQTEGDRKIHAVLVDNASHFAASVKIKVGPWWFPFVVSLSLHDYDVDRQEDVDGGWGVGWCFFWWC